MAPCLKTITVQPENKVQPYLSSEAIIILQQAIEFQFYSIVNRINSPKQNTPVKCSVNSCSSFMALSNVFLACSSVKRLFISLKLKTLYL